MRMRWRQAAFPFSRSSYASVSFVAICVRHRLDRHVHLFHMLHVVWYSDLCVDLKFVFLSKVSSFSHFLPYQRRSGLDSASAPMPVQVTGRLEQHKVRVLPDVCD